MNITQLIRQNIQNMAAYSSARKECSQLAKVYLDANENPFNNGVNRYPDPDQNALKKCIGALKNISSENILLGNGSDEVIDLVFRAFCEPGKDNVIITPPTYGMYRVTANLNNIHCNEVMLNNDFTLNTEGIIAAMDQNTKITFLCSPNNPTGNLLAPKEVEKILKANQGLVFVDEAYIDFAKEASWIKRLTEFPNLIISQTLSKAWGMAGIRLGIGIASPDIIEVLNKIKPPYNINQLSQEKALELLQNEQAYQQQLQYLIREKGRLRNALENLPVVQKIYPSDANFWLVQFRNAPFVYDHLVNRGIILRNRSGQALCDNCLRITVGLKEENDQLINALKLIK